MRVQAQPAGRRIRLHPITVSAWSRIQQYSRNGVIDVAQFIDFLEQERDIEVVPTTDLVPTLHAWLRDAEDFERRVADIPLMPFQQEGVGFLWRKKSALLADDMGLGKTPQALCAIEPDRQALVICPAFLRLMWYDAVMRWRPDMRPIVVAGKITQVPDPGEVLIASYESLPPDPTRLPAFWPGTALIADEGMYLRNYSAKRTRLFRSLSNIVRRNGYCWILNGTPIVEDPSDLWSQMQAAGLRDAYGGRDGFERAFGGWRSIEGMCWGTPRPDAMAPLEPYYLRRLKADVLPQLPPKVYNNIRISISLGARERAVLDEVYGELDETEELFNLQSSAVGIARRTLARKKTPAALEYARVCERSGRPLVVFTWFRETAESIATSLGVPAIHGGVPQERRIGIVRAYQDECRYSAIVCTIKAIGLGVTLTRGTDVLFVDEDYTPANNLQAEDRVHRISQNRAVTIARIIADHPLDRRVSEILMEKRRLAAPVDWPTARVDSVPTERLRRLLEAIT